MSQYDVLVVEDNPGLIGLMETALVGSLQFSVWQARSLKEALATLTRESGNRFDCITLDLVLGDARGVEVVQAIRRVSSAPIIVITGHKEMAGQANDYGVEAVVQKPFGLSTLIDTITRVIETDRARRECTPIKRSMERAEMALEACKLASKRFAEDC